jgi:hypothetical protein
MAIGSWVSRSLRRTGSSVMRRRRGRPSEVSAASPFSARLAESMLKPTGLGSGVSTTRAKVTACDSTSAAAASAAT